MVVFWRSGERDCATTVQKSTTAVDLALLILGALMEDCSGASVRAQAPEARWLNRAVSDRSGDRDVTERFNWNLSFVRPTAIKTRRR
jgi:hypothetical protein